MTKVINFDKIHINKDFILSQVDEIDIFKHYINEPIIFSKLIRSPLRQGDNDPSFNIFKTYDGTLRYKDFGNGLGGNCFDFIKKLYNCEYEEALCIIARDLGISNGTVTVIKDKVNNPIENIAIEFQKKIIPVKRSFKSYDYNYWNSYYIPLDYLSHDNSYACNYVYLHNRQDNTFLWGEHKDNNPIYCYEMSGKHKVYRPLTTDKKNKWLQTTNIWDIQGLEQIPKKGELLIITSSMKDRWVLKRLGYTAIAPSSESTMIPDRIMDYLWACYDNIILFYDNDKAGKEYTSKMLDLYPGLASVFIPDQYDEKDISDFIKVHKIGDTERLMKEIL